MKLDGLTKAKITLLDDKAKFEEMIDKLLRHRQTNEKKIEEKCVACCLLFSERECFCRRMAELAETQRQLAETSTLRESLQQTLNKQEISPLEVQQIGELCTAFGS